jgi:phage/plasmid-associated DNA primase
MNTNIAKLPSLELDRSTALTETALAAVFAERYKSEVVYCPAWRKWLTWTGQRWQPDDSGQVIERAKQLALALEHYVRENFRRDEEEGDGGKVRNRKLGEARAFQSERKLNALVKLARSSPALIVV